MQLTAFTDYGEGYQLDQSAAPNAHQALWGAGAGVNFHFGCSCGKPHIDRLAAAEQRLYHFGPRADFFQPERTTLNGDNSTAILR